MAAAPAAHCQQRREHGLIGCNQKKRRLFRPARAGSRIVHDAGRLTGFRRGGQSGRTSNPVLKEGVSFASPPDSAKTGIRSRTLDSSDLKSLIAAKRPEGMRLEYKRDLPGGSDSAKSEFLADVCALANASGGSLLYGVSEVDGCADAIVGVPDADLDVLRLRLDGIIRSGIEPRVQSLSIDAIDVDGLRVVEVSVGQSLLRPHWVSARGERRFYIRTSVGKAPMSIDEVRSAFHNAGDTFSRATEWRRQAVKHLTSAGGGFISDRDTIWMSLHIAPISAFSVFSPAAFDARPASDHAKRLKTVSTDNTNCRPHFDGLITEERPGGTFGERLLIYRDFRIEAVWRAGGVTDSRKMLFAGSNENRLNNWLKHFSDWAGEISYPFPALLMLSLLNARGSHVHSITSRYEATANNMELTPVFIENGALDSTRSMRPAYDHLWQSYGFNECVLYDTKGKFDSMRAAKL